MGWKSTKNISRHEAISLLVKRIPDMTDEDLGRALVAVGYGDNDDLEYYGFNFSVDDDDDDENNS